MTNFSCQAVRHLKQVKHIQSDNYNKTVIIQIEDVEVKAEPDSGAEVNLMDEHQFKALWNRCHEKKPIQQPSETKLNNLQSNLTVKGEFEAVVRNKTCGALTRFFVIKGRINSPPIIGKNTLIKVGMQQIRQDGSFAQENEMKIANPGPEIKVITGNKDWSPRIKEITNRYKQVFNGIGKIRDIKNDKNFYTKFTMKPEAVPVAQKPRPIAYYLQKPLKKWLVRCINEGIFEDVPEGEPVTWCSPLVVQLKPRFRNPESKEETRCFLVMTSASFLTKFTPR